MERRLAAILAADVVGYSRLMGADEVGTLSALNAHWEELVNPRIAANRGRIVKTMGDGLLAEFASVVDAATCAAEIQHAMPGRNQGLPEDRHIVFRIGINLGDVIVEDDDIFGDGVNLAARLEGLAQPGGICISGPSFEMVDGKTDLVFVDGGEQQLKNIAKPVRVYQTAGAASDSTPRGTAAQPAAHLAVPEKPSIAVLPFTNRSGDPDQEYFADGITEDVITELGRFQNIQVIARNSVFAYKDKSVSAGEIARDLGAHYVVEGSLRKAGQRVRVTVKLVDAETGSQVWAERYDRELTDIFELQDELTQSIAAILPRRLEGAEIDRAKRKQDCDVGVYDYLIRAKLCHHRGSLDDNTEGLRLLDRAIEIDPEFAPAYGWRACTLGQAAARGYLKADQALDAKIYEQVLKGLSLDDSDIECTRILCEFRIEQRRLDDALMLNDKAFRFNPNDPRILAQRGEILIWLGRSEEGQDWVEQAMRLDPHEAHGWSHLLGRALFGMGRYEEAIAAVKRVPLLRIPHRVLLAACFLAMDEAAKARAEAAEMLQQNPALTASGICQTLFYESGAELAKVRSALIAAGLPE